MEGIQVRDAMSWLRRSGRAPGPDRPEPCDLVAFLLYSHQRQLGATQARRTVTSTVTRGPSQKGGPLVLTLRSCCLEILHPLQTRGLALSCCRGPAGDPVTLQTLRPDPARPQSEPAFSQAPQASPMPVSVRSPALNCLGVSSLEVSPNKMLVRGEKIWTENILKDSENTGNVQIVFLVLNSLSWNVQRSCCFRLTRDSDLVAERSCPCQHSAGSTCHFSLVPPLWNCGQYSILHVLAGTTRE